MWGGVAIFVAFAPSWCFSSGNCLSSREAGYIAANQAMPIEQAKKNLYQALWYK